LISFANTTARLAEALGRLTLSTLTHVGMPRIASLLEAEDRGIGADAEREGGDHDRAEGSIAPEHANRVTRILHKLGDPDFH